MFKKLLYGFIFGTGFAIACIVAYLVFLKYINGFIFDGRTAGSEKLVSSVPELPGTENGFLGSRALYVKDFLDNKSGVLVSGAGRIEGTVTARGEPASGLTLRLALNGKVMSQWDTTDADGRYSIPVPYGEYRIDGYELDSSSANRILGGLIDSPLNPHSSGQFKVSRSISGRGLNFVYVKPVYKKTGNKVFSISDPIVLSWEPYPAASTYRIQVYEKKNPHDYMSNNTLFSWSTRPEILKPEINLGEYTRELKSGYFYVYEVRAMDESNTNISKSISDLQGYDFKIK